MEPKKHPITHVYIKLSDFYMKKTKRKLKWKCISISTGAMKIYLIEFDQKLSQFQNISYVNFRKYHFRNKYINKAFFEVIKTFMKILTSFYSVNPLAQY